jgi:hypothetical protein
MINSRQASILLIPETSLKEVIFKRKMSMDDGLGYFTISECIEYLKSFELSHDQIVSTHHHYIFEQTLCIRNARFRYIRKSPGVCFVYQNYSRDAVISDISSEYCF